jgi:ribonuclease D
MSLPAIPSPSAPPVWVSRPEMLKRMVDDLSRRWVIAVDTESNSLFAYREQVCLIQISTSDTDYLVDPLSLSDLSALAPIFATPKIEKVFHAAEYDVICLKRDFGFTFANLFDTMVASRDVGRSSVGLAACLLEEFGVDVDKRYQRANWGARPLSPAMLAYARLDSHYLIPLRHRLKTALEEMDRWPLAEEDFSRLCDTPAPPLDTGACQWWRIASGQDINAREAAVLFEVCQYRDQRARQVDLPAFKVLSNQTLVKIAQSCPQNDADLTRVTGLRGRQLERHGEGLLEAVKRGMEAPPLHKPAQPRPDDHYLNRLERLKVWRRRTGQDWGVESDVILPRDVMEALAQSAPRELAELDDVMASVPWRKRQFGKRILSALQY